MTGSATMMGFNGPGDQRVQITVRDWSALKLALWRSKIAWEITAREAAVILTRCRHEEGCPGAEDESEPCFAGCQDREIRMSALVVLSAARQLTPVTARPANAPYFAPTREQFSEVLSELAAAQIELETLRSKNMSVQAAAEELLKLSTPPPQQTATRRLAPPTIIDHDTEAANLAQDEEQS